MIFVSYFELKAAGKLWREVVGPYKSSTQGITHPTKWLEVLLVLLSILWFSCSLLVANAFARELGLMGQPFINMNKWAQGRLMFVGIAGSLWVVIVVLALILQSRKTQSFTQVATIFAINVVLFGAALVCSFYQIPKL